MAREKPMISSLVSLQRNVCLAHLYNTNASCLVSYHSEAEDQNKRDCFVIKILLANRAVFV